MLSNVSRSLEHQMHRRRGVEVAERRAIEPPVIGVARRVALVVVEAAALRLPFGERRAGIARGIGVVERQREAGAIACAPFVEQLGVDMLAGVEAGAAPIVRAGVRIGQEGLEPGVADRPAVDPHEAAPRRIAAERQIDETRPPAPWDRRAPATAARRRRPASASRCRPRPARAMIRRRLLGVGEL